jgi:lipopolysaccharide export system permease protein
VPGDPLHLPPGARNGCRALQKQVGSARLAIRAGKRLFWTGLMRLLDRYLLREFAIPFFYCLAGFLILWISVDISTQVEMFQRTKLSGADIAQYYLIKTPEQLSVVLPMALLLALLYSMANHARHNEITAMRAAGIGLSRLSLPYFAVGFASAVLMFATNEIWMPDSIAAAERLLIERQMGRAASASNWEYKAGFSDTAKNRMWLIEAYNLKTHEMIRPWIKWTLITGTVREISAQRGFWNGNAWVFTNVEELVYPPVKGALPGPPIETNLLVLTELTETPAQIESEIKIARINSNNLRQMRKTQLSIRQILEYQARHPGQEKSRALDTKLHGRIAAPWTCVVVVLIALPFGALSGKRNVFVGVASSIVICFIYFVLVQVALALGTGGHVVPWLAAWGPNLLFGLAGLGLTWRLR